MLTKPLVLIPVIVVLAVFGGFLFIFKSQLGLKYFMPWFEVTFGSTPKGVWIEVVKPEVFVTAQARRRVAKNGEELSRGTTVETSGTGAAILHFPDGSVARLNPGTSIILQEAGFDEKSNILKVKMSLKLGRIWSRVLNLVSPESIWEVGTPNAVATIRGTAFGMEFLKGDARVLVTENRVKVRLMDPETRRIIERVEFEVTENKTVAIKAEDIEAIKAVPALEAPAVAARIIAVESITPELLESEWVRENRVQDIEFERRIETLRQENVRSEEVGRELNKQIFQKIRVEELRKEEQKPAEETRLREAAPSQKLELPEETLPARKEAPLPASPTQGESRGGGGVQAIPRTLEVVTPRVFTSSITEGTLLSFKAVLVMSDGIRKDVTAEVKWQVLGSIGEIDSRGNFSARLGPEVAEFGEAAGRVVVTWRDSATAQEFLGTSPVFNVTAKVEEIPPGEEQG